MSTKNQESYSKLQEEGDIVDNTQYQQSQPQYTPQQQPQYIPKPQQQQQHETYPQQTPVYPIFQSTGAPTGDLNQPVQQETSQQPSNPTVDPNAPILALLLCLLPPLFTGIVPPLGYLVLNQNKKQTGVIVWHFAFLILATVLVTVLTVSAQIATFLSFGFLFFTIFLAIIPGFLPLVFTILTTIDAYQIGVRMVNGETVDEFDHYFEFFGKLPLMRH